jgi:hypothetical protein
MNCVVIGTDHRLQDSDPGFEGLLRGWLAKQYFGPLEAIAEEYAEGIGVSIGQRLAEESRLRWYSLDMNLDEKSAAGILEEQSQRPKKFQEMVTVRLPSDEVREEAMAAKVTNSVSGTTLVICGYLHFESLVKKLRAKGHAVDSRVYLEIVPEIQSL